MNSCKRVWIALVLGFQGASAATLTSDVKGLPVVFVPGTAGSNLDTPSHERIWLSLNTFSSAAAAKLGDSNLLPNGVVENVSIPINSKLQSLAERLGLSVQRQFEEDVYGGFIEWGNLTWPGMFFVAPYDWRNGADDSSLKTVDAAVNNALQVTHAKKVILLAHSLGGITARAYSRSYGKGKVQAIIALATPWLGSPRTAEALTWGYNFGLGAATSSSAKVKLKDPRAGIAEVSFPLRLSFVDMHVCQELGSNFDCTYQQLPMSDYDNLLASLTKGAHQSSILGLSSTEAQQLLRGHGPTRYDQAAAFKKSLLDGNDLGIHQYLLGGICDSSAGVSDQMDMVFPLPNQVQGPADEKSRLKIDAEAELIKAANSIAKDLGYTLTRDPYVAALTSTDYGDGTVPLLSCTAGSFLSKGASNTASNTATHFLGPNTQVKVVDLEPGLDHGTLVMQSSVQQYIRSVWESETGVKLLTPQPTRITHLEVILHTKKNKNILSNDGTVDEIKASLAGIDMVVNAAGSDFANNHSKSASLDSPENLSKHRAFWDLDFSGMPLTISKVDALPRVSDDWTCDSVELVANGKLVFRSTSEFKLDKSHPTMTFKLP